MLRVSSDIGCSKRVKRIRLSAQTLRIRDPTTGLPPTIRPPFCPLSKPEAPTPGRTYRISLQLRYILKPRSHLGPGSPSTFKPHEYATLTSASPGWTLSVKSAQINPVLFQPIPRDDLAIWTQHSDVARVLQGPRVGATRVNCPARSTPRWEIAFSAVDSR